MGPVHVTRSDSFEGAPSIRTENALWLFVARLTGLAQPLTLRHSLNTIASLRGEEWKTINDRI